MERDEFSIKQIGTIYSEHKNATGTPIQPPFAVEAKGTIEVFDEYADALKDLEMFERVWVFYWFDRAGQFKPLVRPYMDKTEHGLFSTRAPSRPNPIGISCVRLECIEGCTLHVSGIDILDGTPLVDIKPYVPKFDIFSDAGNGWLDRAQGGSSKADERFYDNRNSK